MNIAIIGGTGAVGHGLIDAAIRRKDKVYVFVRKESKRLERLKKKEVEIIECDLEHLKTFDCSQIPRMDLFYFLAWEATYGESARNDMYVQCKNIEYSLDAVRLAKRLNCNTFIGAGSQAEYGRVNNVMTSNTACNPENGYGMAKYCAGSMTRVECEKYGIKHIWCRILSVYGPNDAKHSMVNSTIIKCIKEQELLFTPAEQIWDYLYQDDVGEALYAAGKKGKHSSIYVVASGKSRTLKEYIEIICKYTNANSKPIFGGYKYSDKQVMRLEGDITSLKKDTGFVPKFTFEEGIKITIDKIRKEVC